MFVLGNKKRDCFQSLSEYYSLTGFFQKLRIKAATMEPTIVATKKPKMLVASGDTHKPP